MRHIISQINNVCCERECCNIGSRDIVRLNLLVLASFWLILLFSQESLSKYSTTELNVRTLAGSQQTKAIT